MRPVRLVWMFSSLLVLSACPKKEASNNGVEPTVEGVGPEVLDQEEITEQVEADKMAEALMKDDVSLVDKVNGGAALLENDATVEQARLVFEGLVSVFPDSAEVFYNLGVSYYKLGDFDQARDAFDKALALDLDSAVGWLYMGVVEERAGRIDSAVSRYRTGIQKDEKVSDLWGALVGALRKQGKLDEAIAMGKRGLKVNANNLSIYNNLGLVYLERSELSLARFVYQKALVNIPEAAENASIQTNLGRVYFEEESFLDAKRHLEKAVELDPTLTAALVYLSQLYHKDRNYEKMVPLLETARAGEPENRSVMLNLGVAYRGAGRFDDAEREYKAALENEPDELSPWFNLGILYGDNKKDYAASVAAFTTYIDGGGEKEALALEYRTAIEKEKSRAERRAARDAKRKAREKRAEEDRRLLEKAEREGAAQQGASPIVDDPGGDVTPEGGLAPQEVVPTEEGSQ